MQISKSLKQKKKINQILVFIVLIIISYVVFFDHDAEQRNDSFNGVVLKKEWIPVASTKFILKNDSVAHSLTTGYMFFEKLDIGDSVVKYKGVFDIYLYKKKKGEFVLLDPSIYQLDSDDSNGTDH